MEKLDLNIHNYDLNDLINLFRLPFHFKEEHLKEAKKIVLKTHPDKSGLDKEYFLFFSQLAYLPQSFLNNNLLVEILPVSGKMCKKNTRLPLNALLKC